MNSFGPAGVEAVDHVLGEHDEEREVDRVDAFAEDGPLPAALAGDRLLVGTDLLADEEAAGVLEVVAGNDAAQGLAGRQRLAVAGVDVADLALRHGHQRHLVDPVLPAPEAEVQAAAEHLGLEARLAVQGDDPALGDRTLDRPQLLDDADPVVGDVPQAGQLAEHDHAHDQADQPEHARRAGPTGPRRPARSPMNRSTARTLPHSQTVAIPRLNSFGERTREDCSNRNNPWRASASRILPDRQARGGRSAPRI